MYLLIRGRQRVHVLTHFQAQRPLLRGRHCAVPAVFVVLFVDVVVVAVVVALVNVGIVVVVKASRVGRRGVHVAAVERRRV